MSDNQADATMEPDRILLVDDDPTNLDVLRHALDGRGYRLFVARSGEDALKVARKARPHVILLDVMMGGMDGYETCRQLKADADARDAAVLFLSSLDESKDKVRGFAAGAVDFISKPFQGDEVVARVDTHLTLARLRRLLEARNAELARELEVAQELLDDARRRVNGALLGDSPAIRALRESIARYAASGDVVLLTGAQGAGHEATARSIHHASPRRRHAFIHVNCGLLPAGPDAGLFPRDPAPESAAAAAVRPSLQELAQGGTLFLEEVQRLPPDLQKRLADLVARIEAARERGEPATPDVQVIAQTSAALRADSGFEPRLLALLERRQLRVPGLAERGDDVPELALHFVRQYGRQVGAVVESISEESMKRLRKYRWPGDVKEMQALLERAVRQAREPVLEIDPALLDEGLPLGSYRLMAKLGEGGMGEVWRARHQLLARPCAVKLIRTDVLDGPTREAAVKRFRLEALSIARLTSPNTVRLFDFGVSESGSFYFVMELLEGMDLFAMVRRHGALPPERAVSVLRQACRSLGEAHAAGLLHRDIKPHNLFLCRLGLEYDVAKLLDFGLVKSTGDDEAHLTAEGSVTGTPAFMPPERVLGYSADARSDIYSLGCVGYWMLTGTTVFTGDPMAMMMSHARTPPKPPSLALGRPLPAGLDGVILSCLAKDPEKRPKDAVELWNELGAIAFETPWTSERAEGWWREHQPDLFEKGPGSDSDATPPTPPALPERG